MSYSFPCIKAPSNACNTRRKLHMKTVKLVCSAPMYHEQYEVITNKKVRTITCPDHKLLPWHLQFFCLHYIPERKQSLGCLQSHFPDIFPCPEKFAALLLSGFGALFLSGSLWRLLSYAFSLIEEGWRNGVSEVVWQEE